MSVCIQILNFMIYLYAVCTILFSHFYTILTSVFFFLNLVIAYLWCNWPVCFSLSNISLNVTEKAGTCGFAVGFYTFVANCCAAGLSIVKVTRWGWCYFVTWIWVSKSGFGFCLLAGARHFFFYIIFRTTVDPTQSFIQWIVQAPSWV
jgi:hypothetical protein